MRPGPVYSPAVLITVAVIFACGTCVLYVARLVTEQIVTLMFSLCAWASHVLVSLFTWALYVPPACVFTIVSYVLVPTFDFCGRLTWYCAEKLFDEPVPSDAVLVAIGSVETAILIYGLLLYTGLIRKISGVEKEIMSEANTELEAVKQQWNSIMSELDMVEQKRNTTMSELEMVKQQRNKIMSELEKVKINSEADAVLNKIMSELEKVKQVRNKTMYELEMVKQQRHFEISNVMAELKMVKQQRHLEISNLMSELEMVKQQRHFELSNIMGELEKVKQQRVCVVCLDGQRDTVIKPCRHLCVCSTCAPVLSTCPVCRRPVQGKEKIFDA